MLNPEALTWQPGERRIRGTRGVHTVVDSSRPLLVHEQGVPYATYAFPDSDVRTDALEPAAAPPAGGPHAGATVFYDLRLDGEVVANAAWRYPAEGLAGHIAFEWLRFPGTVLDHWYEQEEGAGGQPPDSLHLIEAVRSSRHVRVEIEGRVVAESDRPVAVFETGLPVRYYLPPEDVDLACFVPSGTEVDCLYKGTASHLSYRGAGGAELPDAAWSYKDPLPAVRAVTGLLSFDVRCADLTVDGRRAGA
ncbi:DUF427 domain-containing protein [Streptomyces beijiangensis]|uniref:DUF427 domain-containing protein n=1 Tax=Streptomyces beijiangensis TaxID=163361 RepID=A0A939JLX9_9ACTN|nr:DUF427 domain-containing protein [Streptomyces beijiangensis]MBO0516199.1 DUF427 domain-containing protein [Streptomyces beijiangensis]